MESTSEAHSEFKRRSRFLFQRNRNHQFNDTSNGGKKRRSKSLRRSKSRDPRAKLNNNNNNHDDDNNNNSNNNSEALRNPVYRAATRLDMLALLRMVDPTLSAHVSVKYASESSSGFRALWAGESWKSQWVELRSDALVFRNAYDQETALQDEQDPINQFQMQGDVLFLHRLVCWTDNQTIETEKQLHQIQLVRKQDLYSFTQNTPVLTIRFSTIDERDIWLDALEKCIYQRRPKLDDFQVISPIGKGASGNVFLVKDLYSKDFMALKVMDKRRTFETESAYYHLVTENIVHRICHQHPFIAKMRYAFQSEDSFFLVTDFYEGADLFYLMQKHGGYLPVDMARHVVAQVIIALEELHSLNVIYRDLKPENVFLDEDFSIRLADFGLGKIMPKERDPLTTTTCGTLAYVSPEMIRGKGYGYSVDFWTLGIFTYNVLFGFPPYEHANLEEVEDTLYNEPIHYGKLDPDAKSFIQALLALNIKDRLGCGPGGMEEVKNHSFLKDTDWFGLYQRDIKLDTSRMTISASALQAPQNSAEYLLRNFDFEGEDFGDMELNDNDLLVYADESTSGTNLEGKRLGFHPGHVAGYFYNGDPSDMDHHITRRNFATSVSSPSINRSKSKISKTFSLFRIEEKKSPSKSLGSPTSTPTATPRAAGLTKGKSIIFGRKKTKKEFP